MASGFFGGLSGVLVPAAVALEEFSVNSVSTEWNGDRFGQESVSFFTLPQLLFGPLPLRDVGGNECHRNDLIANL